MQEENPHLSADQAQHLTQYGVNQGEDGTYSWKFDNYVPRLAALRHDAREIAALWSSIHIDSAGIRPRELGARIRRKTARARLFPGRTGAGRGRGGALGAPRPARSVRPGGLRAFLA